MEVWIAAIGARRLGIAYFMSTLVLAINEENADTVVWQSCLHHYPRTLGYYDHQTEEPTKLSDYRFKTGAVIKYEILGRSDEASS